MNLTISISAIIGAILGYLIWRKKKIGGFWGAVIGFFALPLVIALGNALISPAVKVAPAKP